MLAASILVPVFAEAAEKPSLLQAEPGLAFWTLVTFLVVAAVLAWKVWGPLTKMIDERERSIRESVEQAAREREAAEKLVAQQQAAVQEARREAGELLRRSQADVEKARDEAMARARHEAEELLAKARAQIEEEKTRAIAELRDAAIDLAMGAAGKLLSRSMDDAAHRSLAEEFVGQVEKTGIRRTHGAA